MSAVFNQPSLARRIAPIFQGFDGFLAFAVLLLAFAGLLTMYSSGYDHGSRFVDHGRNMLLAGFIMFVVAQVPPQRLMMFAVPLYAAGRGAPDRGGALRRHQEGRPALAQRRRRDPAQRDPEDRDAADAGLVVPAARRPVAACSTSWWPRCCWRCRSASS
jgi:hypothetical protein